MRYMRYKIQFFLKYESIVVCFFFPPKPKLTSSLTLCKAEITPGIFCLYCNK